MNAQIIAITNQKGGVGKTTTTVNLGVGLAQAGKRVLLVDADPQGSLTISMGIKSPDDLEVTLATLMQYEMESFPLPHDLGIIRNGEGVDLLPSNIELSGLEVSLFNTMSRELVLRKMLSEFSYQYDYILIDCMPSLGMMTINSLVAADSVIIPTRPDFLSTKGLDLLMRSIAKVKRNINPNLRIDGILLTMMDGRTNNAKAISASLRSTVGGQIRVFDTEIPHSVRAAECALEGKSVDRVGVKAHNTYGTGRINAYKIIEDTLNLKDVRIFDYVEDDTGKRVPVLNKKETAIAQGKQELIKQACADWIWDDPSRRERLTKLYNEKFNSLRPREYDGSHLNFVGMNPEITLRPHQVNAIAHILYGGNTLLAHVVGAGKTFEMVAAAQESKRLGLCQKSLFVVPNHLTEQWASEYLQLYPSANILVATKKDFEARNRKRFCARIATGNYDAVIIGHSQFEKIPMSVERQRLILERQLDEIIGGIAELKHNRGDKFSVKQLEKTKKTIKGKLEKLNDQTRKDDLVTFEELGVDRIFVDEAHYYKNLAAFSKMRNVGGISQTEAQKSSDLFMKCQHLDELTGGRGVVFATGTPSPTPWWRCTPCRNICSTVPCGATTLSTSMPGHPPLVRLLPPSSLPQRAPATAPRPG